MVNTRAKIKKMKNTIETQNTPKSCIIRKASVADSDIQSTRSGALIGSNDDVLTEIFRRIPVKSVLRFKSVSKHLNSLLSDPCFTRMYDNVLHSPGLFVRSLYIPFDVEDRSSPSFRRLDFYPDIHGIKIVQSCNGLLLCRSDVEGHRSRKYYVFNPVTKQFAIIPSGGRRTIYFMGLAFHHEDCAHYKLVCIRSTGKWNTENWELYQIQIYYSETGKWKTLNESFSGLHFTHSSCGVYWNRAIHWAPSCLNPLYFDLNTERLQTLPLPLPLPVAKTTYSIGCYNATATPLYFGEFRGDLHLVESADQENHLLLNVFEMLIDHSGWFLKYQVNLHELPVAYPDMIRSYYHPTSPHYYDFEVLDVIISEKEEDTFMVVRIPGRVLRYNIHDKIFKQISDLPKSVYGRIGLLDVHRYTETLASF